MSTPSAGPNSNRILPKNIPFTFSLDTPSFSSGTLNNYLKTALGEDSSSLIPEFLAKDSSTSTPQIHSTTPVSQPHTPISHSTETLPATPVRESAVTVQTKGSTVEEATSVITVPGSSTEVIPVSSTNSYVDITEFLNMPQAEAAQKLKIPASTLSKRWKEAVRSRKWPYRMICKVDKEIMTLLHNVPQGPNAPPLPGEIENALGQLLRKRQEELRPVVIRI